MLKIRPHTSTAFYGWGQQIPVA